MIVRQSFIRREESHRVLPLTSRSPFSLSFSARRLVSSSGAGIHLGSRLFHPLEGSPLVSHPFLLLFRPQARDSVERPVIQRPCHLVVSLSPFFPLKREFTAFSATGVTHPAVRSASGESFCGSKCTLHQLFPSTSRRKSQKGQKKATTTGEVFPPDTQEAVV